MKVIWKYLPTGAVKHAFYKTTVEKGVCGIGVDDYLPVTQWRNDEEGLKKLRPCKHCIEYRRKGA